MKEKIESFRAEITAAIGQTETGKALYEVKVKFQTELKGIMSGMKDLPKEERPTFGKVVNEFKQAMEALFEERIGNLAQQIVETGGRKFIMIAGPSSSGKTSFSNRLSVQLNSQGINCHTIACDDYFINRDDIPFDENGEQNFESIDIVDLNQFDFDMTRLMD